MYKLKILACQSMAKKPKRLFFNSCSKLQRLVIKKIYYYYKVYMCDSGTGGIRAGFLKQIKLKLKK